MISIEDFMEDIVGKAMRGNRISIDQLSSLSNVPKDSIEELLKGKFDEIIITSIAPHLNLDAGSLIASGKKTWRPKEVTLNGLSIYNTQWSDMYVNAFLVWDPSNRSAAVFDTQEQTAKF